MEFCPSCGMLLQFELPNYSNPARFFCPVCPYVSPMESKVKIKKRQRLDKKVIEPIFSEDDLTNAAITAASCPNCGHDKAAFTQAQTRSADEPMTTYYKCANEKCRHNWVEN